MVKEFKLTLAVKMRVMPVCYRCRQKLLVGEIVVKNAKKYYHKKCWDKMFI